MKKYSTLLVILTICAAIVLPQPARLSQKQAVAASTTTSQTRAYAPNQMIVKLKPSQKSAAVVTQQAGRERAQLALELLPEHGYGAELLNTAADAAESELLLVEFNEQLSVEEAIARAQQDPRVEYAEPNFHVELSAFVPNDFLFNQQWGLSNSLREGADIGATRAWELTTGSSDVVVAVIDTGVQISHPDLAANIWVNPREVAGNGVDDDNNGFIDDVNGWNFAANNNDVNDPLPNTVFDRGHGTHVAGIIGAVGNNGIDVAGVAWQVKLLSLPVFTFNNSTGRASATVADIIEAMEYLIALRRQGGVNIRVINASIGGSEVGQAWQETIARSGNRGILFVTSAGNTGRNIDQTPFYPPSWAPTTSNILSVAALDQQDNLAGFSNFGAQSVGVGAPGVNIRSTFPGNDTQIRSGTSQAAPFVAGIAALMWSREPELTPAQVKERILATAEPAESLDGKTLSGARANAYNALLNLPGNLPPLTFTELVFTKKVIFVRGGGFISGSMVVEVNNVPVTGKVRYDNAFRLANGSYTEFNVKMGKQPIQQTFPANTPVTVTIFNQATQTRSAPLVVTRGAAAQSVEVRIEPPTLTPLARESGATPKAQGKRLPAADIE